MNKNGFSLLEMLIVLSIIALLATFTYPQYQRYLARCRHEEARVALQDLANRLELYYSKYHHYSGATIGQNNSNNILENPFIAENSFELKIADLTDNTYRIEAWPLNKQAEYEQSGIMSLYSGQ